ncbi:MAG: ROK family protein, partial [Lactobacillus sp.]|nr:ROK family protein [Lactobacillus sp.]
SNEDVDSLVYYTIGTGVGGGAIINGKLVGSLGHPEMGHVKVKRHPDDLDFAGVCPFHKDCLEGLVSGPTFEARLNKSGKDVPLSDPVWDIMSYYVAQAALQVTLILRPDKIVFGGGVTSEEFLEKVRRDFAKLLNDYVHVPPLDQYITMPEIVNNGSATVGDFALAKRLLRE